MVMADSAAPLLQITDIVKHFPGAKALDGVDLEVRAGEVHCLLGQNGAGKSTLIKVLAGLHPASSGTMTVAGEEVSFRSPRQALDAGIATVYQDLAVVGKMSVWRNFFLGQEITGPFGALRREEMRRICDEQLKNMGIELRDVDVTVDSLSGGQRQVVAIARAIYFGARVLILDEPTAALGVKQSGMVLRFISAARDRGIGVIFITHNPHHAYLVGDHFILLNLGRAVLDAKRGEVTLEELTLQMSGGGELDVLEHELKR